MMMTTLNSMDNDEDVDLELDQMELIAAAAGYLYYNHEKQQQQEQRRKRQQQSAGGGGGGAGGGGARWRECEFMKEMMNSNDEEKFRDMFRMEKRVFLKLCEALRDKGMLRDTAGVMISEQLGIFLNIIGHNERNRVIQERFQYSGETISRHFNNVLKAIKSLAKELLGAAPQSTTTTTTTTTTNTAASSSHIVNSPRFNPYFKDCIGVIDSLHIPAHVPAKDQARFRNPKGALTQNVLAACTFDLQFIFVYPGWEGSAPDSRVLRAVLQDPYQNFPPIPQGKYYLVDLGYLNTHGFIAPYPGNRCYPHEFRGAHNLPRTSKDLFNHRHASLRNAIHKSFHVLKTRFPILKLGPQYAFQVQRDIVIAACVLHNFIRREERNDWLFQSVEDVTVDESPEFDDYPEMQMEPSMQEQLASMQRESMATAMWNDFVNKWDKW